MSLWQATLDLLYPPVCFACSRPTIRPSFCPACQASISVCRPPGCRRCGIPFATAATVAYDCTRCQRHPPTYRRARAYALYRAQAIDDPLRIGLHRFKYGRDVGLARVLGDLLAGTGLVRAGDYDALVPVPLHRDRLRWRGFNQALLLAHRLAPRAAAPVASRLLCRVRPTAPQVALDQKSRAANVAGAFAVTAPARVRERRFLLVDDVLTTGATADACSRALLNAGASSVDVIVLARAAST